MEPGLPVRGTCSFKKNDPGRFYHVTNYAKVQWLKTTSVYNIPVSLWQESGSSIAGCFWLEVSPDMAAKTSVRAVILSESQTWACRSTYRCFTQMLMEEGFGSSLLFAGGKVGLKWDCLCILTEWQLTSFKAIDSKKSRVEPSCP